MSTLTILLPSAENSQTPAHAAPVQSPRFSPHSGQAFRINTTSATIANFLQTDYRPRLPHSGPLYLSPTRQNHFPSHHLGGTMPTHLRSLKGLEPDLSD